MSSHPHLAADHSELLCMWWIDDCFTLEEIIERYSKETGSYIELKLQCWTRLGPEGQSYLYASR